MYIHLSGWHTFNFWTVSSLIVTRWNRWHSRRTWLRFECWLSESVWWRCTCAFVPPACLQILYCAILARKEAVHVIFMKHSRVSYHRSLHIFIPRKTNSPVRLFSDFGARFVHQVLRFLYCGTWNPPLAILPIFNTRRMSDCSNCTQPPCLAIVADILKTYMNLVAAFTYEIRLLPLPYMLR